VAEECHTQNRKEHGGDGEGKERRFFAADSDGFYTAGVTTLHSELQNNFTETAVYSVNITLL